MNRLKLVALAGVVAVMVCGATMVMAAGGIERLYVLDCGQNDAKDQSRWSPGVNEGKPIVFSDNCYLIRHAKGLLLWDTGLPDDLALLPDGRVTANGAIVARRTKTLAAQLAEIGVKPADIAYVAVSHTHGDHVGNIELFPASTVLIQGAEYDWAMSQPTKPAFAATQKIEKLSGDRDVFGDGSVVILSTPGHTPGHQSLLRGPAQDGHAPALRRRRALPRELGPAARAVDEHQPRPDARLAPADGRGDRRQEGPALDQP
jgi:glyoxylase-like metal-dependent hydrolase (beta-lactamase superfamily II)